MICNKWKLVNQHTVVRFMMQPGTLEAFWNLLTASVFLQEESCNNALNKDTPSPHCHGQHLSLWQTGCLCSDWNPPQCNGIEVYIVFPVPTLLLNKLDCPGTKAPVMTCAAARGQCWPAGDRWTWAGTTGGVEHHLSSEFLLLAAAAW